MYIQYMYTLQVCMSISGTLIHNTGWGCHSLAPKKYTVLNGNFVFDLHNFNLYDFFRNITLA